MFFDFVEHADGRLPGHRNDIALDALAKRSHKESPDAFSPLGRAYGEVADDTHAPILWADWRNEVAVYRANDIRIQQRREQV
jgi:hypothetical protein